jgi:hypothetical protein
MINNILSVFLRQGILELVCHFVFYMSEFSGENPTPSNLLSKGDYMGARHETVFYAR